MLTAALAGASGARSAAVPRAGGTPRIAVGGAERVATVAAELALGAPTSAGALPLASEAMTAVGDEVSAGSSCFGVRGASARGVSAGVLCAMPRATALLTAAVAISDAVGAVSSGLGGDGLAEGGGVLLGRAGRLRSSPLPFSPGSR